jgi:iron complex transport system ATP-binding protein
MIEVKDLCFAYPGTRNILSDVSFSLEAGHCLALLGNNGAGKSTLLKCFNRIHEPQKGTIEVDGVSVHAMKRVEIARTMAYVAQQTDAGQLTVFDSVLLGRKPYIKMNPTEEDLEITRSVIRRMDLERYALRYTDELSGGELQKVVLARALAQQPKILLLDEPTSNLDLHNQHEVMRIAAEIARDDGLTVIVVIHDLNLALRYCDRFLFIHKGGVYCYGDEQLVTAELLSDVYQVEAQVLEVHGRKLVYVE